MYLSFSWRGYSTLRYKFDLVITFTVHLFGNLEFVGGFSFCLQKELCQTLCFYLSGARLTPMELLLGFIAIKFLYCFSVNAL